MLYIICYSPLWRSFYCGICEMTITVNTHIEYLFLVSRSYRSRTVVVHFRAVWGAGTGCLSGDDAKRCGQRTSFTPFVVVRQFTPFVVVRRVTPFVVGWQVTPFVVGWQVTRFVVVRQVTPFVDVLPELWERWMKNEGPEKNEERFRLGQAASFIRDPAGRLALSLARWWSR
jgi:hypothetical protein